MLHLHDQPDLFFETLRKRLAQPLPGEQAQNRMTSRARISTADYLVQRPDHRVSAVLLPLFPHNGTITAALIRRPSYEGTHSGQLALPGGKAEETDTSPAYTALREMKEEVGVLLNEAAILGELSPVYIPVSNFLVHPFVAQLPAKPAWIPDPREVDEVIEFPISLLDDETVKSRRRIPVGKNAFVEAPCYLVSGHVLWGATAMMFSELEALLKGE
jgi:8-oxo-dGTP pyrophosphatase MutT (NUDIX family)